MCTVHVCACISKNVRVVLVVKNKGGEGRFTRDEVGGGTGSLILSLPEVTITPSAGIGGKGLNKGFMVSANPSNTYIILISHILCEYE